MSLTKKNINGFCILNIEGRIDTTNYNSFEKDIREVIDSGENNIIFNCSGLDYISSSGLRVFLIALKMLMGSNGKLHLCEMQPAIKPHPGGDFIHGCSLFCVHLPQPGYVLLLALRAVGHPRSGFESAAVNPDEIQIAVAVGGNLEHQRAERFVRVGLSG